tara:strand:+ start:2711 stop:4057 length:1347 start_codon:yes stop_codon:yes gene_type:complete
LNIASALINKIIIEQDTETWGNLQQHYLPPDYQAVHRAINKHFEQYLALPTFDDLKLELRDQSLKEKIYAIESLEVDSNPYQLLEYLKNEYTQIEILDEMDDYIEKSAGMSTADENIESIEGIVINLRNKVETDTETISMQKINALETEEEIANYIPLGLNDEFDQRMRFTKTDLVLLGGRRGSGKSLTCANIALNQFNIGRSSLYFTIEMTKEQTFRRLAALGTNIPLNRLNSRMLTKKEYQKLAEWQADRFEGSSSVLMDFYTHADYDKFQSDVTKLPLREDKQMDIVFDTTLTLAKIKAEVEYRMNYLDLGVVIVDYINQVRRSAAPHKSGQYDWTEQIEISKTLKQYSQDYGVLFFSPYQTDNTGEARFAKGILDAADAAYALETWDPTDNCISFICKKMRNGPMESFTSEMDWSTLKVGPKSALNPKERSEMRTKMNEEVHEL